MASHKFEILQAEILARSYNTVWEHAKLEWKLNRVEFLDDEDGETCACTHQPIKELCFLLNTVNGGELMVGNVCVTNFLGLGSESIFASLRRLRANIDCSPSAPLMAYALDHKLVTEWEYRFSLDNHGKRKLSFKQQAKRKEINQRLLREIGRSHGTD